jgi:hypothetical protein
MQSDTKIVIAPQPGPQTMFLSSSADIVIYGGSAGGAKALKLDTPVPIPSGWTTIGEIRDGDFVFDEQGKVTKVLKAHPVLLEQDCYEITFSDNSKFIADAGHLWVTMDYKDRTALWKRSEKFKAQRRNKRPSRGIGKRPDMAARNSLLAKSRLLLPTPTAKTTKQIYDTLKIKGRLNHSIEVCRPIDMPEIELPIAPYTLGAWLGDGTSSTGDITSADTEVIDFIRADGYTVSKYKQKYLWHIEGFRKNLRINGLLSNKYIPALYQRASIRQRIELLRGLMDTDGTADKKDGHCSFTTTSEVLKDGMLELILGLGIKVVASEFRTKLYEKDCGPGWNLKFITEIPVFKLKRKLDLQKRDGFRGTHKQRYIKEVVRVASVPVRCLTVDSPSKCFLVGRQFVVTHNTYSLLLEPLRHVTSTPGFGAVIFRRTSPQITNEGGPWDTSKQIYSYFGAEPKVSLLRWDFPPHGNSIKFSHLEHETDIQSWDGSQIPLIEFDELQHFTKRMFVSLLARNRSTCGIAPYIRASCNPMPGSWILELIQWWIDGDGYPIKSRSGIVKYFVTVSEAFVMADTREELQVRFPGLIPKSFTFIHSDIYDNKVLLDRDPGYLSNLHALPEHERERLLKGNWKIRRQGKMFKYEHFKRCDPDKVPSLVKCVIAVDPSGGHESHNDEQGIMAVGLGLDGNYYVLADLSCKLPPLGWAKVAVNGYRFWRAGYIVAEDNYGGEMVKSNILTVDPNVSYDKVTATRGKAVRAEPISTLYAQGRVFHVGVFQELENELVGFDPESRQRSPNRLDALVWAISYMHGNQGSDGFLGYYIEQSKKLGPEAQERIAEGQRMLESIFGKKGGA